MPEKEYVTNDMSFAAYLMMRGFRVLAAQRLGKSYKFIMDVQDNNGERLMLDFVNSESNRFDQAVRDLKRILFSGDGS